MLLAPRPPPPTPAPSAVQNVFQGLVRSVVDNVGAKNTQQVQFTVLRTVKVYAKALGAFCTSARMEAALLNTIQVRGCACGWVSVGGGGGAPGGRRTTPRPLAPTPQVTCYEDSRLLKLFADVVKILYDTDVLGEDTIKYW